MFLAFFHKVVFIFTSISEQQAEAFDRYKRGTWPY